MSIHTPCPCIIVLYSLITPKNKRSQNQGVKTLIFLFLSGKNVFSFPFCGDFRLLGSHPMSAHIPRDQEQEEKHAEVLASKQNVQGWGNVCTLDLSGMGLECFTNETWFPPRGVSILMDISVDTLDCSHPTAYLSHRSEIS